MDFGAEVCYNLRKENRNVSDKKRKGAGRNMQGNKSGKSIQSVQRAIDILNCFEDVHTELTLGQLSAMLELNKSTVHGILSTLYKNEFVRQNPTGRYMLGNYFVRKFGALDRSARTLLKEKALLGMNRIADKYRASCSLFMLELGELVLLNRIQPHNEMYTITTYATYIQPLYCTASGKILLAHMDERKLQEYLDANPLILRTEKTISTREGLLEALEAVRREGYGMENEELGQGVYAISVPIYNGQGQLFATVGVTGMAFRMRAQKDDIVADLKGLSQEVTQQLFRGY